MRGSWMSHRPLSIGMKKGHRTPDADFLNKMVAKYSCDPAWLLTGSEKFDKEPELNMDGSENLNPEIRMIVEWLAEVPETKILFVRLTKVYREFNSVVDEIRSTGVRNLRKITS